MKMIKKVGVSGALLQVLPRRLIVWNAGALKTHVLDDGPPAGDDLKE